MPPPPPMLRATPRLGSHSSDAVPPPAPRPLTVPIVRPSHPLLAPRTSPFGNSQAALPSIAAPSSSLSPTTLAQLSEALSRARRLSAALLGHSSATQVPHADWSAQLLSHMADYDAHLQQLDAISRRVARRPGSCQYDTRRAAVAVAPEMAAAPPADVPQGTSCPLDGIATAMAASGAKAQLPFEWPSLGANLDGAPLPLPPPGSSLLSLPQGTLLPADGGPSEMPSSWLSAEVTDDPWREAFVGTHDPWHPLLALSPLAQAACHWPPTVPPSPPEAPSQPPLQIRSAAIKHPSELSARVPPTLPDGAPIALLISLAVASYQYTEQEGGSGSHAPLICSMAALSLAVLWIASLSTAHAALGTAPGGALPSRASGPGAFVRCRLPYAWASFVAAAPLLFLICDVALPLEQTQSRLDKLPARMPLCVLIFAVIGGLHATLPIRGRHAQLSLGAMTLSSFARHAYLAHLTGRWALNMGVAAGGVLPCTLSYRWARAALNNPFAP